MGGHGRCLATSMDGFPRPSIADAITERTVLVSVMAANNEVGTLNPIVEIGRLCHERGVVFHTDAAQAIGKVPFSVESGAIDLLEHFWPQSLCSQRDRCFIRPPRRSADPAGAAAGRRWP